MIGVQIFQNTLKMRMERGYKNSVNWVSAS